MGIQARRILGETQRFFGKIGDGLPIPNLVELQTKSYAEFLQVELPSESRREQGLEGLFREIFPIISYDGQISLDYIRYELGKPRYDPDECRQLRLTFGMPLRVWLRLNREQPIEEVVYLGDLPIMIGGGEFIVNGAERVVVSQLHRSPGVDFLVEQESADRRLHSCRIIPERGSWIELQVGKKDTLGVRIDQSGKLPATTLLRAMDATFSTDLDILRHFYPTELVRTGTNRALPKLENRIVVGDVIDPSTGEVLVESGQTISKNVAQMIVDSDLKQAEVITQVRDPLILNSLSEDNTASHEEALLRIYSRLRPGNPPQLDKARELFKEKFFDSARYRLGRVGRFRLNRKFNQDVPETEMTLRSEDYVNSIRYIVTLRGNEGSVDDIDHLGNRRLRTIDELACEELRKGFLKLRRTVQERMNLKDVTEMTPRTLINPKSVASAIDYFFGRGELSQVVDQTNPLSQLTHERRLSALGPGGLNRKRAGFEVRDVHISHYGRICPIETPEGTNIGLISSLAVFSTVDKYGFLVTPYRRVRNGRVTDEVMFLRADQETEGYLAPADTPVDNRGRITGDRVMARFQGDFLEVPPKDVQYVDISPKQLVGVSAGLIPFLEHDDANRALMGSNMQRQAVPLLRTEPPLVATGLERAVAENSGMVVRAKKSGTVKKAAGDEIVIGEDVYKLRKFVGLNERTCLNQKPVVRAGQRVKRNQVIADGAGTAEGELALGKNVLVGFVAWDGYNFEDAIIISEQLLKEDAYTSIHIDEFEIEIRETKLGREEFTRDIPNVGERVLRNLDDEGIVRTGTRVKPGDILVGKVAPKSKSELSPEEKLLHAIFGRAGEDVKNDSLEVPSGTDGIVIGAQKFSRRMSLSDEDRKANATQVKAVEADAREQIAAMFKQMAGELAKVLGRELNDAETGKRLGSHRDPANIVAQWDRFNFDKVDIRSARKREQAQAIFDDYAYRIENVEDERQRQLNQLKRGDELPAGVLQMVKVYMATRRTMSVGDKVAGRHGNKGVVAKILPVEDMPFLEDGTPLEMLLNPLGVPSRMNVGQILETHLGWAAKVLGFQAITPVFDGCKEAEIRKCLKEAKLPDDGKSVILDGRTGEPLSEKVTVGYMYMMKLHHLVDDKVHARATGPYSLITQQPLGGKARFGGQRFGEMEVWALEAYGAAYVLQELLTVKSDDVEGRTKIYEAMVKGENTLEAGTPASFDVLTNEIRGLGLNLQMEKKQRV